LHLACPTRSKGDWSYQWLRHADTGWGNWIWVDDMKKVSERAARLTIAMMRSMASCKPISPFHLEASKEMEAMLEELLALRKKLKEKPCS
jgi:hypothetical protein